VSKAVKAHGRWRDCKQLVAEWNASTLHSGGSDGLFLELGANIGACTMEVLLLTSARVVAFEPSPVNLFHLTRSLRWAAAARASLLQRVVVLPVGIGDSAMRSVIVSEAGNLGNSRIASSAQDRPVQTVPSQTVDVYPLDTLFPEVPLTMPVYLMKLDIQGFECRALRGASALLLSGGVHRVAAETSKMLKQQKCSAPMMRAFLRRAGYSIVQTGTSGASAGYEVVTIARMNP
jgi:FkbM family methyltransferase